MAPSGLLRARGSPASVAEKRHQLWTTDLPGRSFRYRVAVMAEYGQELRRAYFGFRKLRTAASSGSLVCRGLSLAFCATAAAGSGLPHGAMVSTASTERRLITGASAKVCPTTLSAHSSRTVKAICGSACAPEDSGVGKIRS